MWLLIPFLTIVHVLVCLLLVGAVLMQLPRSEGLGAAFGGGMTENLFGAQTTHVLAKLTVWLGIAFFVLTLLLAMTYSHSQPSASALEQELLQGGTRQEPSAAAADIPAASPSPAAAATTEASPLTGPVPDAPAVPAEMAPTPAESAPAPALGPPVEEPSESPVPLPTAPAITIPAEGVDGGAEAPAPPPAG